MARHFVAFGVWPVIVCPVNQGHTSSGVHVHGHDAEQVLGGVAHELYKSAVPSMGPGPCPDWLTHQRRGCPLEHPA